MASSDPVNETGKWLLQSGLHRGTLMSRDSGSSEHATEADARSAWAGQLRFWRSLGYGVWFAYLIPPGASYVAGKISLHPGEPYV